MKGGLADVYSGDELRAELEPLTDHRFIVACAALPSRSWLAAPDAAMSHVLGSLARRWLTCTRRSRSTPGT